MRHSCQRHAHLSRISACKRTQPTGTQSHIKTEALQCLRNINELTWIKNRQTWHLILESWSSIRTRLQSRGLGSSYLLAYPRLLYLRSSMSLPSQASGQNHEKLADSITQIDQSYFRRCHKKSIDGRRDYRSSYVTPKLYQHECLQKIWISSHWTVSWIRACCSISGWERWNVSIFSGVVLGQHTHGENTLGFVSHSSSNHLVNMGSINFARTLHGTYKLVLGVVVNAVVGLAYWVIYGDRPAVVFSAMVFAAPLPHTIQALPGFATNGQLH